MSILGIFQKRSSSAVARDRLQLILAHERAESGRPDLVIQLREEILAVIANHVAVEPDKVKVTLERGGGVSTLGLDIELPLGASASSMRSLPARSLRSPTRRPPPPRRRPDIPSSRLGGGGAPRPCGRNDPVRALGGLGARHGIASPAMSFGRPDLSAAR